MPDALVAHLRFVATAAAFALAATAAAASPPFTWPVDCTHGRDCWIVRHVDRDPGPGVRDVACGELTGDAHKGTDIALADMATLALGVAVRAPAAGRVVGVRDGMPDVAITAPGAPPLEGRNCGNGVRLEHADGWSSQLCHLRRGSLTVRQGDRVAAGAVLGLVGLSGETTFPHLHVQFERDGVLIDAMDGAAVADGAECGGALAPLFAHDVAYATLPLVGVGVAPAAPEDADILRGWHREETLPATAPALVVWMHGYGTRAGDVVVFELSGPAGEPVVAHRTTLERGHARGTLFAGARRPAAGWTPGRYQGAVEWRRGDAVAARTFAFEITAAPPSP